MKIHQFRTFFLLLLIPFLSVACGTKVYTVVDEMPSYPGGQAEMMRFVSENLRMPAIHDEELSSNSKTVVRFIVRKTGELTDIEPLDRYKQKVLSDSLVAIVKRMPRWNPGKKDGKAVDVIYPLPLDVGRIRKKADE